jgi:hypothetical protein
MRIPDEYSVRPQGVLNWHDYIRNHKEENENSIKSTQNTIRKVM